MLLEEILLEGISPLEQLKEIEKVYRGDRYVSVSFTNINKVGINPKPIYDDTPIGIYCYPISYVIRRELRVPTAGGGRFLQVMKPKDISKVWDLQETSNDKGKRILECLIAAGESQYNISSEQSREVFDQVWSEEEFTNRVYFFVAYLAREISNNLPPSKFVKFGGKFTAYIENKLLRAAGIDAVYDDGTGMIHEGSQHK